jgi:hypothetical protein
MRVVLEILGGSSLLINTWLVDGKEKEQNQFSFTLKITTRFWNNLHQVRSKAKDWRAKLF